MSSTSLQDTVGKAIKEQLYMDVRYAFICLKLTPARGMAGGFFEISHPAPLSLFVVLFYLSDR